MVRLHVVHHQIVRGAAAKLGFQVFQPLLAEVGVYGVQNGNLFVQKHIGIVGHAVGDSILPLEQVHLVVVDTDIANVVGNKHRNLLLGFSLLYTLMRLFTSLFG